MREFYKVTKYENIILPCRSTNSSAGYDFFCANNIIIKAKEIGLVPTGVKAKFPEEEVLFIFNRSSNPLKYSLILANGVGVIDSDYYDNEDNEGEIFVMFYNISNQDVLIKKNQKIAQGIFLTYHLATDETTVTKIRTGGFGSTGK